MLLPPLRPWIRRSGPPSVALSGDIVVTLGFLDEKVPGDDDQLIRLLSVAVLAVGNSLVTVCGSHARASSSNRDAPARGVSEPIDCGSPYLWTGLERRRSMLASAPSSRATIAFGEKFLYDLKAGQRSDRAPALLLPDTTAAVSSMAVSRTARSPTTRKKTRPTRSSRPVRALRRRPPSLAAHGRRVSAASNRSRRCQPPTRSASPPSSGTRATTSISANLCPGLIGTNTGPSSRAGTANSTKARTNRIAQPCSHLSASSSRAPDAMTVSSLILPT